MEYLVKFFLAVAGLSTIIIYLGKKLIDKTLDAGIEKYKINLSKELELFKSELTRTNVEHQVRYSKLHEQRGEKIKELYHSIYELEKRLKFLTSTAQGSEWPTETQRAVSVSDHLCELEKNLELNRIYFTEIFCEKIATIIKKSKEIMTKIDKAKYIQKHHDDLIEQRKGYLIENPHAPLNSWVEAESDVEIKINAARFELVKEFHTMIGVK